MAGRGPTRAGKGILLLFVCAIVFAQSAALVAQFEPHHAAEHCCLLCHVGALPFLQVAVASTLAPMFRKVWSTPAAETTAILQAALVTRSSRAPPAAAILS